MTPELRLIVAINAAQLAGFTHYAAALLRLYHLHFAATITGSNVQKGTEMPAEGKGERQSAGTVSGGSDQAPTISDQKQDTPAKTTLSTIVRCHPDDFRPFHPSARTLRLCASA